MASYGGGGQKQQYGNPTFVDVAKEEVASNIVNGEEDSHDETASESELPSLGLKAGLK